MKVNVPEMIALYREGWATADLAKRYGVNPPAITKQLNRHGVKVVRPKKTTRADRIKGLLSEGLSESEARRVVMPQYHAPELIAERVRRIEQERRSAEALVVDRNPCTYCGVRGDVGCKHNRWAA